MIIERGGIYIANLNPHHGTEPGKTRPVVVVQTDLLNQAGHPSTIVCPLTTHVQKNAPLLRVRVPKEVSGLSEDSDILVDQIRAIDNRRFRHLAGRLPAKKMLELLASLKTILDMGWV